MMAILISLKMMVKIGVIREGKNPPDKRVPLSPKQCEYILDNYDNVEVYVQKSEIRKFTDKEYSDRGVAVVDSVDHCDILIREGPSTLL